MVISGTISPVVEGLRITGGDASGQGGCKATVDGVLWHNNTGGAGSVYVTNHRTGAPLFAPDGYHLTELSAAIDQGLNAGVRRDIDSEPRLGTPDLGADEYWAPGAPKTADLPLALRNH